MVSEYLLGGLFAAYLLWQAVAYVLTRRKRAKKPYMFYHKPSGKLLVIPANYDAGATQELLADLDSLPPDVYLNSPGWQAIPR